MSGARTLAGLLCLLSLILCTGHAATSQTSKSQARETLRSSTDRALLEQSASQLAVSGDPNDLALLGRSLRDPKFLARLDDLNNSKTQHFARVMTALGEHPTPQVVDLCLALAEDPAFQEGADRKSFVLQILAGVKPMSEKTAQVIQRSNEEGYFSFNAPMLAANGSPHALELFETMMLDKNEDVETRVESLHKSIVPRRADPALLNTANRILSRASEPAIAHAVVESCFAFHQEWFGLESGISQPAPWQSAPAEALPPALLLADAALKRRDIKSPLRVQVSKARETIAARLAERPK